jgi:hypothetical protein
MLTAQLFGTGKRWRSLPDALALLWHEPSHTDLLFGTLNKSEASANRHRWISRPSP